MEPSIDIHGTFTVTSGSLCFGGLHNIWGGSLEPVQEFRRVDPKRSGTVQRHDITHNVRAKNGPWNVFQLVDIGSRQVVAWFVCHTDVDPAQEIDKILRVSGSPYEHDSGSSVNNESTFAEGVLVINRYDWGYYDSRYSDEIGEGVEEGSTDVLANSNSAGLVDLACAQDQVREWTGRRPSERGLAKSGVWMYSPHAEYMFGRFGFNDARDAARSFLFFSIRTVFTSTAFAGLQQPLRKEETPEERFERRLREGVDFSSIATFKMMTKNNKANAKIMGSPPADVVSIPDSTDFLGPFGREQHIYRAQDLDALRLHRGPPSPQLVESLQRSRVDVDDFLSKKNKRILPFVEPWKQPMYDFLNELFLTYLVHTILPRVPQDTALATAESLFPDHMNTRKLDHRLASHFKHPDAEPIANLDTDHVESRVQSFLSSQGGYNHIPLNSSFLTGISRALDYVATELLELSNSCARDNWHFGIMPGDVRISIANDNELYNSMKFSRVLWEGTS
ncbi:hypothetical protein BX600DRAFT_399818 [Xylariales sp. PMI_506]|nr:hypothetical protein BX600DRAFT_399818 [Xylariales sp. PMI_506]